MWSRLHFLYFPFEQLNQKLKKKQTISYTDWSKLPLLKSCSIWIVEKMHRVCKYIEYGIGHYTSSAFLPRLGFNSLLETARTILIRLVCRPYPRKREEGPSVLNWPHYCSVYKVLKVFQFTALSLALNYAFKSQ